MRRCEPACDRRRDTLVDAGPETGPFFLARAKARRYGRRASRTSLHAAARAVDSWEVVERQEDVIVMRDRRHGTVAPCCEQCVENATFRPNAARSECALSAIHAARKNTGRLRRTAAVSRRASWSAS
ncbi:hypothetical protein MYA_1760 [Burkholderia sp. KJ006]|nr:hypothetical protein MYA_1760 [Burkholderia sp. KJ006]